MTDIAAPTHGTTPRRKAPLWVSVPAALLIAFGCSGEEDPLAEIRMLQAEGAYAESVEPLRQVVERNPEDVEASYLLALALMQLGRHSEAVFPLSKAARSEEYGARASLLLATALAKTRNMQESVRAAERVLAADPENQAALLLRARGALEIGWDEAALDSADRLVATHPGNLAFQLLRVAALAASERVDEAEALLQELREREWEDDPDAPARLCLAHAEFLKDQRDEDAAAAAAETCAERFPERADVTVAAADLLDGLERPDAAIELLQEVSQQFPSPQVDEALARQLIAADRFEEAEALVLAHGEETGTPQSWRLVAAVRQQAGNYEGALEAMDRAIEASAAFDEELLFVRADLLLGLGRLDEAEALLASFEEPLYRSIVEGRLAEESGDYERALELLGNAVGQWPNNHGLRVHAAIAAMGVGDLERAKIELLETTRAAPKETDAALWLARVHLALGEYTLAAQRANRHIRERGVATPEAHLLLVRVHEASGRRERIPVVLDDLEERRDGVFRPDALAARADVTRRYQGPQEALEVLDSELAEKPLDLGAPASEPVLTEWVQCLVALGRADEGQRRVDALVAAAPDQPHLVVLAARLSWIRGDREATEAGYARALELSPGMPAALAGQALILHRTGEADAAIAKMDEASQGAAYTEYAYKAAVMALEAGDREGAERRYEEVLRLRPDHPAAANDLASLLAEREEDLDRALRLSLLASRTMPQAETLDTLGLVQLQRKELESARRSFELALAEDPDYATARYHMALALTELGDLEGASEALRLALASPFPEQGEAEQLLARIDAGEGPR